MSQINKIGVIGAGNMGSGIAQKIAQEGIHVVMVDLKDEFVERGLGNINLNGLKYSALHRFFQGLFDVAKTAFDKFIFQIDHDNMDAFLGDFLSDTASHVARTDYTDLINLGHLRFSNCTFII